jgi:adenylosuccinate lyase
LKEDNFGYDNFLSPFTWRYGSKEMRKIFSEIERRTSWRRIWIELAKVQADHGLISQTELRDLASKAGKENIDMGRAHEIEHKIRHDLMAELHAYAESAKKGGGKLHLGATSMDIEDNADMLLARKAMDLILTRLVNCLGSFAEKIVEYKDLVCMGWTHLQPAEPTTLGYRLANYAQDLVIDLQLVETILNKFMKGKGMKGAVGTSASYNKLLGGSAKSAELEERVMKALNLDFFPVSTQTYPRKVDYLVLACLASIGASCHKFGFDLRILQSPTFGELSEPIGESQVGSSAMPFKKNPVNAERMCSLARFVSILPNVGFMNAANSLLERTLDDSASRRLIIPEAFLAIDECLMIYERLMRGLRVYPAMIGRNLHKFGKFAGTEAVLMELVEHGSDRQEMHELIRICSFKAWEEVMKGNENPLVENLCSETKIASRLSRKEIEKLLNPIHHVGDAKERAYMFVNHELKPILVKHKSRLGIKGRVEF